MVLINNARLREEQNHLLVLELTLREGEGEKNRWTRLPPPSEDPQARHGENESSSNAIPRNGGRLHSGRN